MNISTKTTVTFSKEDLQTILEEELKRRGFENVGKISANTQIQSTGYGMGERDETVFTGITVEASLKSEDDDFKPRY